MKTLLVLFTCFMTSIAGTAQTGRDWLKTAVLYQIFEDSNGDGIGDLKGIQNRLDYAQSIGVNTIWINPIFASAFKDGGYDVTTSTRSIHFSGQILSSFS